MRLDFFHNHSSNVMYVIGLNYGSNRRCTLLGYLNHCMIETGIPLPINGLCITCVHRALEHKNYENGYSLNPLSSWSGVPKKFLHNWGIPFP